MGTIPKIQMKKVKQSSPDLLERSMLMLAGVIKPNIKSYYMTNKNEWIKTSERLPDTDRYVWVAGEMKYNFQKDIDRFVDIGWLDSSCENANSDAIKWYTINDWDEGQEYFKITHWAEIKRPNHPINIENSQS